jgi:predicted nucleic acid-binding protein
LLSSGNRKKLQQFETFCNAIKSGDFPFDAFDIATTIYSDLRGRGITVEDADIFIAAFCISKDCTLVTHNVKHFKNIRELKYVDWVLE